MNIQFSEKDLRKIKTALYYFSVITENRIDETDEMREDTERLQMLADKYRELAERIPKLGVFLLVKEKEYND